MSVVEANFSHSENGTLTGNFNRIKQLSFSTMASVGVCSQLEKCHGSQRYCKMCMVTSAMDRCHHLIYNNKHIYYCK